MTKLNKKERNSTKKHAFSLASVVEVYQVVALGMDGKTVGCAFVECTLPPIGEVVERVDESFSVEAGIGNSSNVSASENT